MEFDKEKELEEIHRLYKELEKTWDEPEYEAIYAFNDKYFKEYKDYLETTKGFTKKTINKHYYRVSFFINEHLTRYLKDTIFNPSGSLEDYFGYFLLYKCMFTTKNYIIDSCSSIISFYKFMLEKGYVTKNVYDDILFNIEDGKERWIEELWNYEHGCDQRTLFYKALEESVNNNDN